jgi:hypothetical protein
MPEMYTLGLPSGFRKKRIGNIKNSLVKLERPSEVL